jgi:hypothetical protein
MLNSPPKNQLLYLYASIAMCLKEKIRIKNSLHFFPSTHNSHKKCLFCIPVEQAIIVPTMFYRLLFVFGCFCFHYSILSYIYVLFHWIHITLNWLTQSRAWEESFIWRVSRLSNNQKHRKWIWDNRSFFFSIKNSLLCVVWCN